jgi:hypothetical protein
MRTDLEYEGFDHFLDQEQLRIEGHYGHFFGLAAFGASLLAFRFSLLGFGNRFFFWERAE